ncbi:sensor histidine kinase [Ectobacillus ponti]|uniref:histidine kinase n=1 Tax=Ectobacillus ponti TaxID=2961894 RepID=A0AA41XAH0_9BACI|nr:HAMP domain-containing histidine kinase [Ectobacillus ponti]
MRHISIKIGFYFFICTFLIQIVLFVSLYYSLVNTRVNEEVDALLARGNSHRDVLQKNFDAQTIGHVALMESESETNVVIASATGKILAKSKNIDFSIRTHMRETMQHTPAKSTIIEDHWKTSSYICTVSPILSQGTPKGYVYMFQNTSSLRDMIDRLTSQFFMTGCATFLFTVIAMFFLSRILTKPLIRMKEAAEKMSKGDLSVSLDTNQQDEVGELALAIQTLATDLHYMKQERSEFLASVAHELRTPLTYVRGYADIAKRGTLTNEERKQYLSIIQEEADRVTRLVNDLFELAQMEKHNFVIHKKTIDASAFLQRMIAKLQPSYEQKHVTLSLQSANSLYAAIDEERFEQVMMNLLNNALAHSEPHSRTTVTAAVEQQALLIQVQDEGEGIPAGDIPHVFERFYRVDKSRTRAKGGSGLGLAIVKEIVELHGGSIAVRSSPGKGTVFTIQLPL